MMAAAKHVGASWLAALKVKLHLPFVRRLIEQTVVAFAVSGWAAFEATGGSYSRAAVAAGIATGLRAAYGIVVKHVGEAETPSVK